MSDGEIVEVFTAPASVVEVYLGIPGAPGASGATDPAVLEQAIEDYLTANPQGGAVDSVAGKTGVVTLVKGDVGLGLVDNTADADKPVSTAQATALAGKASMSHSHAESDVTGLTAALAGKADAAATTTALAGKASTSHTHAEGDVTGLTAALAAKLDTSAAPELIRDTMGTALVAGTNVTITPNDGGDTITIAASGGSSLNGPTPSVEVGVVTHSATGATNTVSEWTVTVSAAFYLESLSFVPNSTQSFELKIDGVAVSTLAGTSGARLTFPVAQTIATGARTFRITAQTSATTWNYNVAGNKLYYGVTHGFVVSGWSISGGFEPSVMYKIAGHGSVYSSAGAPTHGTWVRSSIVYNSEPAASGYIGWVCVTAGTPGTWKGFGLIQA